MKSKILILTFLSTGFVYSQAQTKKVQEIKSDACDFIYEADTTLKEKTYTLASYLTDGCDVYYSTQLRSKFAEILQTKIPITKEYFKEQFKRICVIDKCALEKVGVYRMSVPGEVMLIIAFKEK